MIISKRFLECVLDLKASFKLASHGLAIRATTNSNPLISSSNEEEEEEEEEGEEEGEDYNDYDVDDNNNNNWKMLCVYVPCVIPAD